MSQFSIRMIDVDKWFGPLHVLKKINLDVAPGEHIVLCGPSGSGKSTLIRCINALEETQGGRIVVNGTELGTKGAHADDIRRDVGMVFQQFNLFPHMTALENCMLAPKRVRRMNRSAARETAMRLLQRVHVADKADKYPAQLSGGQQQRVAIARALCMEPKIMLFDEPTSALDPELVGEVLDVMRSLAQSGMTMIVVTHEMGFARRAAHRVVFMADGAVVEDAEPAEFFDNPRSDRARDFLSKILEH
mgnify:CR=1 FL=1